MKLALRIAFFASAALMATANYEMNIASKSLYYAGAAYCDKSTLDNWNCGEPCKSNAGVSSISRIENELLDTFGFVTYNSVDNEIVVSFRGTNGADFMNWLTNIVYYRVQYADVVGSQVHSGFYTAYSSVSGQVRSAVKNLLAAHGANTPILFTGHSLGAALATFAILDIKKNLNPTGPLKFYSFGSPRVGNQVFTDYLMSTLPNVYQRVTHYTDVVVQIPPRQMGFNHAGNEAWYYNDQGLDLKICENNAGILESTRCADSYLFTTGIDAHLHYLDKPISGMCSIRGVREVIPTTPSL